MNRLTSFSLSAMTVESVMEFVTRSLSPQESRVVLALAEQGRREIERPEIVHLLGVSAKAADHVIHSLRRKGWLERASWGKYLLIPPDQGPEALGSGPVDVLGYRVMMSDREKTTIDCVDRPDLAGGAGEVAYVVATASRRLDWQTAADYLERIGSKTLVRRFGWLADHAGADIPACERERLLRLAGSGRKALLGPKGEVKDAIGYVAAWHLFVNMSRQELQASGGLGRRRTVTREA